MDFTTIRGQNFLAFEPSRGNCDPKDDVEALRELTSGQSFGEGQWNYDDNEDDDEDGER